VPGPVAPGGDGNLRRGEYEPAPETTAAAAAGHRRGVNILPGHGSRGGTLTRFVFRGGETRQSDPPLRGVPLRWRLGLTTSIIVTLVLGSLTFVVQRREIDRGWEERETLLAQIAAPLASDLEAATTAGGLEERIRTFQDAHFRRGYAGLHAVLRDTRGRVAASSRLGPHVAPPPGSLRAEVPIRNVLLPGGSGLLEVWQEGAVFGATIERRWKQWLLSLAVAIASILLSLYVAYQLLIDRPLRRLLDGVRQMEMGYWSGLPIPRGAWEMRWLAYRFRNLGTQLEETVRRLVQAERRAMLGLGPTPAEAADAAAPVPAEEEGTAGSGEDAAFRRKLLRRYLLSRCRYLEARGPGDAAARAAARESWERDVLEAERLGEGPLKSRLEDAALRILEPEAFDDIRRRVASLPAASKSWLRDREVEIRKSLALVPVKHKALQHRVKHPAGIWRKMQSKGLALDQIHDVVAFRIIVPSEQDCYAALAAIHERFEPLLLRFKDYIAEPKANGYRSLHTCVRSSDGLVFEVQIRTLAMHQHAEGGGAAHWRYKASPEWSNGGGGMRGSFAGLSKALRKRRVRDAS